MKKVMLMMALVMVGAAVMATGSVAYTGTSAADINVLIVANKLTEAKALLNSFDSSEPGVANSVLSGYSRIAMKENGAVTSIAEAKTRVATLAALSGNTTPAGIVQAEMNTLYSSKLYQLAYDYFKTMAIDSQTALLTNSFGIFGNTCNQLKKYDEAAATFISVKQYTSAQNVYKILGNKEKVFEFGKKAALSSYLSGPSLTTVLNIIGEQDFSDTAVTPAMQADFLKAVDLKYRRFLVTDKVVWEPIIASIRLTLQGYGVEVK